MGIVGSDFVAVACIVAGGVLGGSGWNALGANEAGPPPEPPLSSPCSGVTLTAVSAPDVAVLVVQDEGILLTPRASAASHVHIACGEVPASADELKARTRRARLPVINLRRDFQSQDVPEIRFHPVPEPPR